MPERSGEARENSVESLLRHIGGVDDALRVLRDSEAATVVFRGADGVGWMYLGGLGAEDVLLADAAARDLRNQVLEDCGFWVGDPIEAGEDEDGDEDVEL